MLRQDEQVPETIPNFSNLVELLRFRATRQKGQLGYRFLLDGESREICLTYGELDKRACSIATMLQSHTTAGERALLVYPPGLEFISAFFGCLYAGLIVIATHPPHHTRIEQFKSRVFGIMKDATPSIALTTSTILEELSAELLESGSLQSTNWFVTDFEQAVTAKKWLNPSITADDLAFIQYTSGSTTDPKGVMITHGNLMHNLHSLHKCFWQASDGGFVSWLPPYHDLGLIGGILVPLHMASPVTLMSPVAFVQRPRRWLQAISRFKGAVSGGPNFAYDLCVRKISPEQCSDIDLTGWRVAINGAEPVDVRTLEEFIKRFKPCGFAPESFKPSYGLAESTLMVSINSHRVPPLIKGFIQSELKLNRVVPCDLASEGVNTLVACGQPIQKIVIVDPDTLTLCPPNLVGEIWVSGPSVARGYWNHPRETEDVFDARLHDTEEGPFLKTGDLGFLLDGQLFVTGRSKDLIIVDGCNHYPQDIERTVGSSHAAFDGNACAAFSINISGREELVVVATVKRLTGPDVDVLTQSIRTAVSERHDLRIYDIALVKMGCIPKTLNGKIKRQDCRKKYLAQILKEWKIK